MVNVVDQAKEKIDSVCIKVATGKKEIAAYTTHRYRDKESEWGGGVSKVKWLSLYSWQLCTSAETGCVIHSKEEKTACSSTLDTRVNSIYYDLKPTVEHELPTLQVKMLCRRRITMTLCWANCSVHASQQSALIARPYPASFIAALFHRV